MTRIGRIRLTCLAVLAIGATTAGQTSRLFAQTLPAPDAALGAPPDTASVEDAEMMLRGPLHEAYASPMALDAEDVPVVPKEPPEPIEEVPPDAKPEGDDAVWIPGYWAWDEDRDDFIWVSGVWRVPPEDRRWVPGYWTKIDGGYQWVSGFWAELATETVRYLPTPPATLETGPTSPQPSPDHYWVSGCWMYQDPGYAWRPGYWITYQDGWVWSPAHYVWTPLGAVFVRGYWDYPLARRGVVFAPVCFRRPIYRRHDYVYSPSIVVDTGRLVFHLFVYPRRCHYYWGDYYGFRPRGGYAFYPWYNYHGRHGYDPMFAYYAASHHRLHIDYGQRLRGWYNYFDRHPDFRPPRTLDAQLRLATHARGTTSKLKYAMLGRTVSDALSHRGEAALRLERLSDAQRQAWKGMSGQINELARQRVRSESNFRHGTSPAVRTVVGGDGKPSPRRSDPQFRLPDLPQIAKVRPIPGAPRRPDVSERDVRSELHRSNAHADTSRAGRPDSRSSAEDRAQSELRRSRGDGDTARDRRSDVRPPSSERPRIESPKSRGDSDAVRDRRPDVRPPSSERPRIESPKSRGDSDAVRDRRPDVRPPSSERPRVESPKPRGDTGATREFRPEIRTRTFERPRIEASVPRADANATRAFRPEIRPPTFERPRVEASAPGPDAGATRVLRPEIRTPTLDRPRFELPTPRTDAGATRFVRPESRSFASDRPGVATPRLPATRQTFQSDRPSFSTPPRNVGRPEGSRARGARGTR